MSFLLDPYIIAPAVSFVVPYISDTSNLPDEASPVENWYRRCVFKSIYEASAIQAAGWDTPKTITSISINVTNVPTNQPLPDYSIGMINTSVADNSVDITSGYTTVFTPKSVTITLGVYEYVFDTPFLWNGVSNIGISWAWGQCPIGYTESGAVRVLSTRGSRYSWTDTAGTFLTTDVASNTTTYIPEVTFHSA